MKRRKIEVVNVYESDFGTIPIDPIIGEIATSLNKHLGRIDCGLRDKRTRGGKLMKAVEKAVQAGIDCAWGYYSNG